MKKIFSFLLLFLTITSIVTPLAQAHVLVVDKNIGAVMHVDPDDAPVAREQSSFFFEFKDTQNKFDPKNCNCTFSIIENGKMIYTQPLFQNSDKPSLSNASVFYTFPQEDVYQINVTGKPNTPREFQPFTLVYNIRVDQIAAAPSVSSGDTNFFTAHLLHFVGAGIVILIFVCIIIFEKIAKNKKSLMKGGEKKDDKENQRNKY
jgi:hypothetical protein